MAQIHHKERTIGHYTRDTFENLGARARSKAITQKILQTGYFWPSMTQDTNTFIIKSHDCQMHSNIHALPPTNMTNIISSWPFFQWGIDIIGRSPKSPGRLKFLIVAVDYFKIWVKAEAVAIISGKM